MSHGESAQQAIPEAALLLDCLRGLSLCVPDNVNWQALLDLSAEHGVLLLIHKAFTENRIAMDQRFTTAVRKYKEEAENYAAALERLLNEFAAREIAVLPLKGPALADALYGDATLRSCDDLDLLVDREDFSKAERLLLDMGFAPYAEADDYHRGFRHENVLVELHFGMASPRAFPIDLGGIWNRSRQGKFRAAPMQTMAHGDFLLFLCLHGLKHGFSRLIWITDISRALGITSRGIFKSLVSDARQQDMELPLLIGCEMVREVLPQQFPSEIQTVIEESPEVSERARRVVQQLFAERTGTTNDPEIWSLYLQMESGFRERWLRRLSFLTPTVEDFAWAERHHIHHRVAPVLRPFRLLKKYGPSRAWRILFPRSM